MTNNKTRKLNMYKVAMLIIAIISFGLMVTFGYKVITADVFAFVSESESILSNQLCFFGSMVSFVVSIGELFTRQIAKLMEV